MNLKITASQASKFRASDRHHIKGGITNNLTLKKPHILLGRADAQHQCKYPQEEVEVVTLAQKSLSRNHAIVSIPSIQPKKSQERMKKVLYGGFDKTGVTNGIPSYYAKLGKGWQMLSCELLAKIRQYCRPEQAVVVKDLQSKYGTYIKFDKISLPATSSNNNLQFFMREGNGSRFHVGKANNLQIQFGSQVNFVMRKVQYFREADQVRKYLMQYSIKINEEDIKGGAKLNQQGQRAQNEGKLQICGKKQLQYFLKNINKYQLELSILIAEIQPSNLPQKQNVRHILFAGLTCHPEQNNQSIRYLIGRHRQCQVHINKEEVSRKQFSVKFTRDNNEGISTGWELKDLSSTNGSWIRCHKAVFRVKDFIGFGVGNTEKLTEGEGIQQEMFAQDSEEEQDAILSELIKEEPTSTRECNPILLRLGELRVSLTIKNYLEYQESLSKKLCEEPSQEQIGQDYERILDEISGLGELSEQKIAPNQKIQRQSKKNAEDQPSNNQEVNNQEIESGSLDLGDLLNQI